MDELALSAKERMERSLISLEENFALLRTGRANPAILAKVTADYYGEKTLINQICAVSVPEPRQIIVKPYDRNDVKAVAAGIVAADLGFNPQVEADLIRIIVPPLTEDTRKQLVKKAKALSEDAKIATRNIRREYNDLLKSDDSYSDDLKKRIEADVTKVTEEAIKQIDAALVKKEKEIMTI